jgi:phage host-nuclease inhibitor protein Gam
MTTDQFDLPLEEYLLKQGEPEGFEGLDREFVINNDDDALWAMRGFANAQRRINEIERQGQKEIDRINLWIQANTRRHQYEIDYYQNILQSYLNRVREDSADGRKSLDFPDGVVSSRITPSKVSVSDIQAFVAWAETNGHEEWIRIKKDADVSSIKKVVDYSGDLVIDPITGEVIEGLSHVEGGLSVTIKVSE